MRYRLVASPQQLIVLAREKLGLMQHELADAVDSSLRTVGRWEAGQSRPADFHFHRLARLLHPVDPALALDAATMGGKTLEDLGIVPPPAPPPVAPVSPPPAASAEPSPPPLAPRLLVDSVVCAVAEALEMLDATPVSMKRARAAVEAAFRRARDLRLEGDDVIAAFASAAPDVAPPSPPDAKAPAGTGSSATARRRTPSAS